jgi:hypothetical protein
MAFFRNYLRMIDGPYPITNAICSNQDEKGNQEITDSLYSN